MSSAKAILDGLVYYSLAHAKYKDAIDLVKKYYKDDKHSEIGDQYIVLKVITIKSMENGVEELSVEMVEELVDNLVEDEIFSAALRLVDLYFYRGEKKGKEAGYLMELKARILYKGGNHGASCEILAEIVEGKYGEGVTIESVESGYIYGEALLKAEDYETAFDILSQALRKAEETGNKIMVEKLTRIVSECGLLLGEVEEKKAKEDAQRKKDEEDAEKQRKKADEKFKKEQDELTKTMESIRIGDQQEEDALKKAISDSLIAQEPPKLPTARRVLKCSKISEGESEETCRRNEKRILLKSFHCEYEDVGGKIPYINCEFHLVDLETNEIHLSYLPPLLNCAWDGEMSALDRVVYILGGLKCNVVDDSHFKLLKSNSPQSEEKFYLGASRFDLGQQSQGGVWGPAPASTKHSESILCATLFGKIYALGPVDFTPEVFDPAVGHWKTLCAAPPELDASILSDYLLPDPSNNCILVHFTSPEPSLYAFTPPTDDDDTHSGGGTWKCLHSDFRNWSHVAAVVDGLLFLYSPGFTSCLRVFDIAHRRWLKVRWIKRFGNGINIKEERIDFDALLPLSDKILCLAVWSPMDDPDIMPEAKVIFAKFTAQRIGKIVYLIPLSTHTYVLEETNKVHQFLPV